jgi:hypothetical protein
MFKLHSSIVLKYVKNFYVEQEAMLNWIWANGNVMSWFGDAIQKEDAIIYCRSPPDQLGTARAVWPRVELTEGRGGGRVVFPPDHNSY